LMNRSGQKKISIIFLCMKSNCKQNL